MSHHFHCFYPNPNQLHFSPRRFPRASLLVSPLLLLPCYLVFKTAFRTVLFIVTFCLNCLKGFPLNSEFKPKIFQRSTKTHSSSTPASCHSCYIRVSLPVPHTYQACLYPRDFAQAVPAAWNALLPCVTPSLLYVLQFFAQMLSLWGQHWLSYLKWQTSFLNSVSFLFRFFSPQHLSPLMYYKIFLFLVSLPVSLSLFPLFGSSQLVPLASHATYGSDLERELGCVLAAGLISICRLPPRGRGFLCLLFLDVFSSTRNSPCM